MRKPVIIWILLLLVATPLLAQNWEANVVHDISSWQSSFMHDYSDFISNTEPYFALGVPIVIGTVGYFKNDKALMQDALFMGVSVVGTFGAVMGLKYLVNRTRPYDAYPDYIHPHSTEADPSFPSGHTSSAFALATSICIRYPKWYVIVPSALWAGSVALSRLYEGVHYPTDVLGGACVGIGCTIGSYYLTKWLNKKLFD